MKLQTATRLALLAVLALSEDPARSYSSGELAERFGVSEHHLAKVLRALKRAGLVEALRGVGGGYRFRANPKRVTLLEVIEHFEDLGDRGESDGDASPEGQALARVLREIDDIARATLGSISLTTMRKLSDR